MCIRDRVLIYFGYEQSRVRIHGNIARIELLPEQIQEFVLNHRKEVYQSLKEIGFDYITLDLEGYRMGSMNETIEMCIRDRLCSEWDFRERLPGLIKR